MAWTKEELEKRFDELVAFLKSQGHSDERARQIVGNHAAAVAEDFDKAQQKPASETTGAGETKTSESSASERFESALSDLVDELRAEFTQQHGR